METTLQAFLASVRTAEAPAPGAPLLKAVWHGLRGDWSAAHEIAQEDHSSEGAWVHAWLHRIEGDLSNAGYWYRRAQRPVAACDTASEAREIAAFLLRP